MITVKDFDLGLSAMSGQPLAFFADYEKKENKETISYATPKGSITIKSSRKADAANLSYSYKGKFNKSSAEKEIFKRFSLNENMQKVYEDINTDPFMDRAINEMRGLRVTSNDPWETTICFVISQFNNIKRIRGIIKNLSSTFGDEIEVDGKMVKLFPRPEALANADLASIRKCGTGFRDKYIKRVAEECVSRVDLNAIQDYDYPKAKEELLKLDGIGDKVADCILLFGYRKLEAFPIDVWVKRVVETTYFRGRKKNMKQIHAFAEKRWPGMAGYANQYLFWNGRENKVGKVIE